MLSRLFGPVDSACFPGRSEWIHIFRSTFWKLNACGNCNLSCITLNAYVEDYFSLGWYITRDILILLIECLTWYKIFFLLFENKLCQEAMILNRRVAWKEGDNFFSSVGYFSLYPSSVQYFFFTNSKKFRIKIVTKGTMTSPFNSSTEIAILNKLVSFIKCLCLL